MTLLFVSAPTFAQLSVAISDNVLIINEKKRSGSIDLVNLGLDPVEFTVSPIDGRANEFIRWSPSRVLVPANRSARLRVMSMQKIETSNDERLVRLGITAEVKRAPEPVRRNEDGTDAVAVTVPVVPTLPLFVYIRSSSNVNKITLDAFVATSEDGKYSGYFPISKAVVGWSFVGEVKVIDAYTGETLSEGRVHLPQGTEKSIVRVIRSDKEQGKHVSPCIQLWDQYPAVGEPLITTCP